MLHTVTANPVLLLLFGSGGGFLLSYLKIGPAKLISLWRGKMIFSVSIEQTDEAFYAVNKWLSSNYARKIRTVKAKTVNFNGGGKRVKYFQKDGLFSIRYLGKRIVITGETKSLDKLGNILGLEVHTLRMYGYKAEEQIKALIQDATNKYSDEKEDDQVIVYTMADYSDFANKMNVLKPKSISDLIYSGNTGKDLLSDVTRFLESEQWYLDRSITYKRSYLFYGDPGTGKSTMIQSLAKELGWDIFVVDLSNFLNNADKLNRLFKAIPQNCFLVFEDVDRVLGDPEKVKLLNLSTLLNALDGPYTRNGSIIFMTANDISKVDSAIFRDGRIDVKLEIQ